VVAIRERFLARLRHVAGLRSYPTAANFVLVRCEALPAAEVFRRLFHDFGILIRDVSSSPGLSECLRISIGTEEDMGAVIAALEEILARPR
jgi:histidinol-phosphate aminotransferase